MRRIWPYLLLALVCGALFFWRLGAIPLIGLDEGLYSECSREMLASGDYVVPTCNGADFFDKPPLAYWLQAGSMRSFGVNSFAVRFPSAVEELLLVALTVFLGTRIFSRRAGLLSGFALASSLMAAGLARMAILDSAFALAITASLGAFLLAYLKLAPRWCYLLFWAAMGLSVMVKGPAGAVLVMATLLIFLAIRRDLRGLAHAMPLTGALLAIAIAAPWYVLVQMRTGGRFLVEFLIHQNLQRALGKDFQHNMPFFFYLPVYLVGLFPWSAFVPAACKRSNQASEQSRIASVFLTVWICAIFAIFSIFRSKLPAYIYPIWPASTLLVGALWDRAIEKRECSAIKRSSIAAMVVACLIGGATIVTPLLAKHSSLPRAALICMGICVLTGTAAATVLIWLNRPRIAFAALCCGMCGLILSMVGLGLTVVARTNAVPAMALGRSLSRFHQPVFAYQLSPPQPQLGFYARMPIPDIDSASDIPFNRGCLVVAQKDRMCGLPPRGRIVAKSGPYIILSYPPTPGN